MAEITKDKYFDAEAAAVYVREVRAWARKQLPHAKANLIGLKNKEVHGLLRNLKKVKGIPKAKTSSIGRQKLIDSLKTYTSLQYGVPQRVSFPFAQHGFYLQEGYSRGHGKGKERTAYDWYSFLFLYQKELLADIVARHDADAAMNMSANLFPEK